MRYTFDPAKAAANLANHGVSFKAMAEFEWETALVRADTRHNEPRLVAFGLIGSRLHVLVYTVERRTVRLISLRKANRKEITHYATA